jgi:hypothetical protein
MTRSSNGILRFRVNFSAFFDKFKIRKKKKARWRNLEKMQREDALRMQESRVEWARHQDRENYKRELGQLQQLREQQRREEGNRATAY